MFVKQLDVQHFRCFVQKKIKFDKRIVLIEGVNGSGKTSLLEALHYACYLRSFRTYNTKELTLFDKETFCIKVNFEHTDLGDTVTHKLHVGYSSKKRLVKLNDKSISSYKELMGHFRIITLTEDDLGLIKLGPDQRRQFIDQAISLYTPEYMQLLKEYKIIADNRNKLLQHIRSENDMYHLWSEQLWHKTAHIQAQRKQFLTVLQQEVNQLLKKHFPSDMHILFSYRPKKNNNSSWHAFFEAQKGLFCQETRFGRSLFGAHLDDISITFQGASSRTFASRGQQKLTLLLIKIAQVHALNRQKGAAIFLLDDFMTDFDQNRAALVLQALTELNGQLIFTVPSRSSILSEMLAKHGAQSIKISD